MPAIDKSTIKETIQTFAQRLRTNLIADPPTATKPFRKVVIGDAGTENYPRPFLAIHLNRVRPVGVMDDDKIWEVSTRLRLVTDAVGDDELEAVLDGIGALEDYLDDIVDTGVIEGAEGFNLRTWTFDYPKTGAGPRVMVAEASENLVVKVDRSNNREPTP